jgi:cyclase
MAYGGGITTLEQVQRIFAMGFEKVVIDTAAYATPHLIREAVAIYGSQSIVGCVDVRRTLLGRYELNSHSGKIKQSAGLKEHVQALERLGVGEIIVNAVDRDGTQSGYDLKLIREVSSAVSVPVVACGGAAGLDDFVAAVHEGGASAVAAGSLFVFVGPHRAVLINYPNRAELSQRLPCLRQSEMPCRRGDNSRYAPISAILLSVKLAYATAQLQTAGQSSQSPDRRAPHRARGIRSG